MIELRARLEKLLEDFREEARENKRLVIGLGVVGLIIGGYIAGAFLDAAEQARAQVLDGRGFLARETSMARQTEWLERSRLSAALRSEIDKRLWRAATPGLAAAGFQDWIQQGAKKSGLKRVRINIKESGEPVNVSGYKLQRLEADVSAAFSDRALEKFLRELEHGSKLIVVNQLEANAKAPPRIRFMVTIYVELGKIDSSVQSRDAGLAKDAGVG